MKEKTCIALFSGGLDSMLSVKHMMDRGFKVIILNFNIGFFFDAYEKQGTETVYKGKVPNGWKVEVVDISREYYEMIKNPAHGYGKNMNPCIDCKILMLKKAGMLLEKYNAGFVITGEVLGQRPMTQNPKSIKIIQEESGLGGYLVRPLCGKLLSKTEPQKQGWLSDDDLLDIHGRTRVRQLELADEWGLSDFVKSPGGGCILTDKVYSRRLKDYLSFNMPVEINKDDVRLLALGRHFKRNGIRFIIGRNKTENEKILKAANKAFLFEAKNIPGPIAATFDEINEETKKFIAAAVAGYLGEKKTDTVEVEIKYGKNTETVQTAPLDIKKLKEFNI